jgi:hypothetical protein
VVVASSHFLNRHFCRTCSVCNQIHTHSEVNR